MSKVENFLKGMHLPLDCILDTRIVSTRIAIGCIAWRSWIYSEDRNVFGHPSMPDCNEKTATCI